MAISLTKGGNVNLSKEAPGLNKIIVGLGWDARATDGAAFDLDASAFLVKADGKVRSDSDFCFFNNKVVADGAVEHMGDNTTGVGDGDDEVVKVQLSAVPADLDKVVFTVTIYDAETRKQNFGQVSRAYIRIVNEENSQEIARYDLSEDASVETAMIFGEIYRNGGDWKFKAVGQGFAGGLGPLATSFGVNV
ncbi:TerD family protein [Methylovulum psychrotolerans]|jgi:tellurium resistance protein TerD|uniref:Chemical-damaging agent resistance protein C n=2 Tax=Methylovulum psychrotolerans TaxID=1704499 RepID=A0A1Z4C279_9GAMM|nr:TerD family protein [Methylovulum psychrotolerans]ASF47633.1 chemical-damaging agent resistance protein C [Methylovulum psychrotolerans]MBT9098357.1 TerD family protein [Methylovulum psychrotolerans]POZ54057.1 chemical-damaging agent resistance protein C [Methylovulum psychrotolerans]